jgi:hypothetical protein
MKLIDIKFAELHNTLFLAGTNHGQKLDTSRRLELRLAFDESEKRLIVQFNGEVALIPESNVSSMTPRYSKAYLVDKILEDMSAKEAAPNKALRATAKEPEPTPAQKAKVKAQVWDPTSTPVQG